MVEPNQVKHPNTGVAAGADLLAILQFGDSFFPSGATAFSFGLESLWVDGQIQARSDVGEVLRALIEGRWAGFDRPLMLAAYEAGLSNAPDVVATLRSLDQRCEAMTLNEGARSASRRLGATQLKVHAALGMPAAQRYLAEVEGGRALAHLAIVQGIVARGLELGRDACEAMSAFGLCLSVVGAAVRIGVLGHLDGQRVLSDIRPVIGAARLTELPELDDLWNATPELEIAGMRHEPRRARMFSN